MKKTLLILSLCLPLLGLTQTWADQNSSITNDLEDVHFADNNNGWAVGRQGKIIRTTNAGSSWSTQNSATTKDLNKVFMVNSSAGYAVGDGGTVLKYNGSSWSALNINFSQDMYGVYFLDASTGWVSGDWGCIKMTTDGGTTWTTQMSNSVYSNTFNDLHMISASEGWAVGSSGKILKYNGSAWTSVSSPASGNLIDLHAVSFSGSNDGFASGESSGMFHYDGTSWSTFSTDLSNTSYHIYDVHMITANSGYAATSPGFGGQGLLLKYDGSSWAKDYEYTGMNSELFTGITSTPNGNVYAVASTGLIKAKTSGSAPTGLAENPASTNGLSIYPNPSSSLFIFEFPLKEKSDAVLTIKDINGKILKTVTEQGLVNGVHFMPVDGSGFDAGIYFYTLTSGGLPLSGKIVKIQ